jgi:hypothetical protein
MVEGRRAFWVPVARERFALLMRWKVLARGGRGVLSLCALWRREFTVCRAESLSVEALEFLANNLPFAFGAFLFSFE